MNDALKPLQLPRLEPMTVRVMNVLLTRAFPWRVPAGHEECLLAPAVFAAPFTPELALIINAGGVPWPVTFGSAAIVRRHPALDGIPAETELPEELAVAALTALAEPLLPCISALVGAQAEIADAAGPAHAAAVCSGLQTCGAVTLMVSTLPGRMPSLTVPVSIGIPTPGHAQALSGTLLQLSQSGADAGWLNRIPFTAAFVLADMPVSPAELAGLETGDLLFAASLVPSADTLTLRIPLAGGRVLSAGLSLAAAAATVQASPTITEEFFMDDTTAARDDIPVTLSFELERRQMPLAELTMLAPGYTFALAADMNALVTIAANGKPIGKGRLVDIDGTPAVQVTELR